MDQYIVMLYLYTWSCLIASPYLENRNFHFLFVHSYSVQGHVIPCSNLHLTLYSSPCSEYVLKIHCGSRFALHLTLFSNWTLSCSINTLEPVQELHFHLHCSITSDNFRSLTFPCSAVHLTLFRNYTKPCSVAVLSAWCGSISVSVWHYQYTLLSSKATQ